ncbi:MAG: Uma2 family endonuclease [Gallionellaceae bacterium]|nr:Uma2 family endonuclease [Gallionellaceae bacterium]
MGLPAEKFATYEDLFDLPENLVGEIINGRLVTHPRPAPKHARSYSGLGAELWNPFDRGRSGPGGWWILDEPEIHIDGDILVPDIAGWRRERMPKLPETAWFDLAPDWLCEILSPSTARVDRVEKLPIYARWGVKHVWLVDPDLRTLEAYENVDGRWLLLAALKDDDAVSLPPFDAISFALGGLWVD